MAIRKSSPAQGLRSRCACHRPEWLLSAWLGILFTACMPLAGAPRVLPPWPELSLRQWRFDAPDAGAGVSPAPLQASQLEWVESFSGAAVHFTGPGPRLLQYRAVEPDGGVNLSLARGAVRLWFSPEWTSARLGGTGPGATARLLDAGAWALYVTADGNTLAVGDAAGNFMAAPVAWSAWEWHLVSLHYGPEGTTLYLDGVPAAQGSGLPPPPFGLTTFTLGGDAQGGSLAQGALDEVTTFARPQKETDVAAYFRAMAPLVGLAALAGPGGGVASALAVPTPPGLEEGGEGGGASPAWTPPDYGCALWLEISRPTNGSVLLTLHNTLPGTNYQILSSTNLPAVSWNVETNVTGATGQDWTQTLIVMGPRTNLFLIASELRTYTVDTNLNFAGLDAIDTGLAAVPDTMGAIGPAHFVELLLGKMAVFSKTNGAKLEETTPKEFFNPDSFYGTNYPFGDMTEPRLVFDHEARCWVAAALHVPNGSGHAVLAICTNENPSGLLFNWTTYPIPMAMPGAGSDYLTLGLDANGIYLTTLHRRQEGSRTVNAGHTIVAIKKPEIYQGVCLPTRLPSVDINATDLKVWTIQPAVNFDAAPSNAPAWLVAKGPPQFGSTAQDYHGGAIHYRRLHWSGTNALLLDMNWVPAQNPLGVDYRNYYDIEGINTNAAPITGSVAAPQLGGSVGIELIYTGSRLMNAVVRGGRLYTCHHVGLAGTNGTYAWVPGGTNVDRSAVQWFQLQADAPSGTLTYLKHGRIYDAAPSNAHYYYFPSVAVNCADDVLLGFSSSSATSYIGAYYVWRPTKGATADPPTLFRQGDGYVNQNRWGDYSYTSVDPQDGLTFWTVQQHALNPDNPWGTQIAKIRKP